MSLPDRNDDDEHRPHLVPADPIIRLHWLDIALLAFLLASGCAYYAGFMDMLQ